MNLLPLLLLLAGDPEIAFPGQWAPPPAHRMPSWPGACARFQGQAQTDCLVHLTSDWARLSRYRAANAQLPAPKKGEQRVVFIGASITDNWSKAGSGGFFPGRPYVNR